MDFSLFRGGSAFGQAGVFCGLRHRSVTFGHEEPSAAAEPASQFSDLQKVHKTRWDQVLVPKDPVITSGATEDAGLAKRGTASTAGRLIA
tara:strand:+ start:250 stop:519 length:270 start_codon:yes stop_codon:yes gene_type:complete